MKTLTIVTCEDRLALFHPILQKGFHLQVQVGCSLYSLLCDQLGVMPDYLEERIKTIFLDRKPVDNMRQALIHSGAVLALSAAMPGLVGATFRRGGVLGAFRSTITHRGDTTPAQEGRGEITLKLFNLLMPEMGPGLLARGITTLWGEVRPILDELRQFRDDVTRIQIDDGQPLPENDLTCLRDTDSMEPIHLKVRSAPQ